MGQKLKDHSASGCATDPKHTFNPLIEKLKRFVPLTELECGALRHLTRNAKIHRRGTDLIKEGEKPMSVFLMTEGWAFRYKHLADGSRQISAYLIPGDVCDVQIFLFERMDHSIGLLSDAKVVAIPAAEMLDIMDRFPRIERAFFWATLVDESTLREWLLNIGQRTAKQKLAHLFCELCIRLRVVGLVDDSGMYTLPPIQSELGDTTGMTTVHVNRSLQRLRADGLISTKDGTLTILDFPKLARLADFDEEYLHTDGPPVEQKLRERLHIPM